MMKWFNDISENDFQLVGGKAYNLSKMIKSDIDVPNGFVVLSTVYDEYVKENDLQETIKEVLEHETDTDQIAKTIKSLFSEKKLKESRKNEILNHFDQFKQKPIRVAVRSSSTVEDLPGMSFAGQYSSYLNVTRENLIESVIKCWQSLWHKRAIEYRRKYNITNDFTHAVVIQEMINATTSGVAFTANPLTGVRHEVLINASYGLGEAIVSGEVTPDLYCYDTMTHQIKDKQILSKEVMYEYCSTGIELKDVNQHLINKQALSDEIMLKLIDKVKNVEMFFGRPQDIEFAVNQKNDIYILQSRDITTLYPIESLEHDDKLRTYLSASTVLLGMKEPFTPLGYDIMSHMFPTIINVMTRRKKPLTNNFVKYAGNRIYVDMSYLMASKFVSKQFANVFSGNDLPLKGVMYKVIEDYGHTLRHQGIKFRLPFGVIKYGFSMIGDVRTAIKIKNEDRYDAMIAVGNQLFNAVEKRFDHLNTMDEKLDFSVYALVEAFKLSQRQSVYCLDANNIGKIEKILKRNFGDKYIPEVLVQSLPRCFTQTMMVKLNEYAKVLDENNEEATEEDQRFKDIIDVYGHRGNTELDLGTSRWREEPSYLLDLVKSYMTGKMYIRNLESHNSKRDAALQMIEDVYQDMKSLKGGRKAEKLKSLMTNYRTGAGMREYPKSDIVRFLELGRKALQDVGQELVDLNLIDRKNDIFFIHLEDLREIRNNQKLRMIVDSHKEQYMNELQRNKIPRVLMNNGATYYSASTVKPGAKVIQGMALAPGTYEGKIRMVYDPKSTVLKEGEILVTESTNPAWTPMFAVAGALIMEYGGPMSHGGIVAREYGIPAVVGISAAMSTFQDGQRVRVNGETGLVELIE